VIHKRLDVWKEGNSLWSIHGCLMRAANCGRRHRRPGHCDCKRSDEEHSDQTIHALDMKAEGTGTAPSALRWVLQTSGIKRPQNLQPVQHTGDNAVAALAIKRKSVLGAKVNLARQCLTQEPLRSEIACTHGCLRNAKAN
jgi:hypothetical protein